MYNLSTTPRISLALRCSIAVAAFFLGACSQTVEVLTPVNNVQITTPPQGTLTLRTSFSTAALQNQNFSVLVYQNGILKAMLIDNGTTKTDATGVAAIALNSVNTTTGCMDSTPATLPNGAYKYYFSINVSGGIRAAVNVGATGTDCGANGFIDSTVGGYSATGTVTINGDTELLLDDSKVSPSVGNTFEFLTGKTWNFRCYIADSNITAYTTKTQLVSLFSRSGDGLTTGDGVSTKFLPQGSFSYLCYADTNTNGNYFESGTDKLALGVLTSLGNTTTRLYSTYFNDF